MDEKRFCAVICGINSKYVHSSLAPWYLAAGIAKFCPAWIAAQVVEGTVNEDPMRIAQRISDVQPEVVGFSCYIWNMEQVRELIRLVKESNPNAVIVLGGPEVSYRANEVLRADPLVDFVIAGEGELPFAQLINALSSAKDFAGLDSQNVRGEEKPSIMPEFTGIPGLCYRKDSDVIVSAPYTPADEPPDPYTEDYFTALRGRIAYLETSRGCPFSCAFCLSGRCGGVRFFPIERAKAALLRLANSGARTVKLVDRTFNAHPARARKILHYLLAQYGRGIPEGVRFHFEVAGDLLDPETLRLLAAAPAGLFQLEIGLQSFHAATLEAIHRRTDVRRLVDSIRQLTEAGNVHIHIDLIAGLPQEDLATFAESFNTAYALKPHMLQLGFLKLLHGAPMREDPENYPCEYSDQPPYEVLSTPWLSPADLTVLHRTEDAVDRLYNSGRFRRTLEYVLAVSELSPFELFRRFGESAAARALLDRLSLDDYTALAYAFFSALPGVDRTVLRDRMVCDRLAANAAGRLPPALRVEDTALKRAIRALEQSGSENRRRKGVRRGYALLYTEQCLVYADYDTSDPVTGEYILKKYSLMI